LSRGFRLQDARRRERRTAAQRKFGATIREGNAGMMKSSGGESAKSSSDVLLMESPFVEFWCTSKLRLGWDCARVNDFRAGLSGTPLFTDLV